MIIKSRKSKWLKIILINLLSIFFLMMLTEFGVRLFYSDLKFPGTEHNLILDSKYFSSPGLKPNSSGFSNGVVKEVDDHGFWKYSSPKKSNAISWLLLGDSVTMGIGVESDSTFAGRINNIIEEVKILNPSLIAYTSKDYLNVVKYLIEFSENKMNISRIFLFWCLNDVYPNHPVEGAPGVENPGIVSDIKDFLRQNSKTYHLFKNLFTDRPKDYYEFDVRYYNVENPRFKEAIHNIKIIIDIADNHNIEIMMFLLPYEYQLRNNGGGGEISAELNSGIT